LTTAAISSGVALQGLDVSAYTVPTDQPESDGTLRWDSTTIVVVEAHAGDEWGLGYTYGPTAVGTLIESMLAGVVEGRDALAVQGAWAAMQHAVRNAGRPGIAAMAISAVDCALWDLKARLLGLALADLLGAYRESVPVYGSGGFTSYTDARLAEQLGGWVEQGIPRVKMKVGREPGRDPERVHAARAAIGDDVELMVDGNGAYERKQALWAAERFAECGVSYFEEPVSSDDLEGLRLIRDRAPAGMSIAAGEYGWNLLYFRRMIDAGAVDILQADVTRCMGITSFLRVDALCKAHSLPLSMHCAPALSAHAGCAVECLVHLEYFHDHARLEGMLFDGTLSPEDGRLRPDSSRRGLGLELRRAEAERFAA
jgi:L-alanine-DL-glutamate epimerase-like enolase superfamily enzyme